MFISSIGNSRCYTAVLLHNENGSKSKSYKKDMYTLMMITAQYKSSTDCRIISIH